ncbi:hypothetical protein [Nitrosomonas sp.]|uniref:hypothetical protein n=1 Tax=Nitrosomonas sp. TaxID=42353 RepID=UPI00284B6593|nr:hypothetical protein [Nitrosomonas sp.]MDR4513902.1 hypothetical protein [Nitrosomonas sp.]
MKLLVFIIFLSFPALQSKNSFAVTEQERLQSQIEKQKTIVRANGKDESSARKHAEQQLMKKRLQTAYPEATINSPDGYYLVSPSNVIRLTVVEHSKSDNY